jgi:hypothetical protein
MPAALRYVHLAGFCHGTAMVPRAAMGTSAYLVPNLRNRLKHALKRTKTKMLGISLSEPGDGHASVCLPPALWRGTSPLLDLEDPRLRLRVQALTQLCTCEREKALALYGFVKRMPFAKAFKMRLHTAREVLDQGRGDSADKATLLVAMLRLAGLPARLRFLTMRPESMRGLVPRGLHPHRPVLQVYSEDRWVETDTYLFDAAYAAGARERLRAQGWEHGYGLHRDGPSLWDGRESCYLNACPPEEDPLVLHDHGCFCDPLEFVSSPAYREEGRLARALQWNMLAPRMDYIVRELRGNA